MVEASVHLATRSQPLRPLATEETLTVVLRHSMRSLPLGFHVSLAEGCRRRPMQFCVFGVCFLELLGFRRKV